jgi:hypothetical protein
MHIHSPVHSSIGTPSGGVLRHAPLGLLARQRFQGLFHSPHRGAFHRSLAVLVRYRSLQVLSLGEWSPQLPAAFHGRRRTRVPKHRAQHASSTGLSPSAEALSSRLPLASAVPGGSPVGEPSRPHNPRPTSATAHMHGTGLGSSAFARHYLRSPYLFLGVLRCFSSPGSLHLVYRFNEECRPITAGGLPHSGIPGSQPALRLPRAFRSAPRPSSACNAKASTSDACSLTGIPVSVRIRVALDARKNAETQTPPRTAPAGPDPE